MCIAEDNYWRSEEKQGILFALAQSFGDYKNCQKIPFSRTRLSIREQYFTRTVARGIFCRNSVGVQHIFRTCRPRPKLQIDSTAVRRIANPFIVSANLVNTCLQYNSEYEFNNMCEIRSDTVSLRRLTDKPIDVILHNLQDESECSRTVLSQRTLVIFYQCKYCLYDLCSDIIHDITYIFYCFILSFLDSSYYSLLTRLNSKIKLNYSSEKVLKKKSDLFN